MADENAGAGGAEDALGLEVGRALEGQGLGAGDAAELGQEGERDDEDEQRVRRAEHGDDGECQDEGGEGADDVEHGHESAPPGLRQGGGEQAERDAGGEGQGDG